jgi:hypothetical protein
LLFSAFCIADFVFSCQKSKKVSSKNEMFSLKEVNMGLQHAEFYADFSSKEIFEKSAPQEVRPKNRFFWGFRIFAENPVFRDYLFTVH